MLAAPNMNGDRHLAKRQRTTEPVISTSKRKTASKIFAPYRTIGLVSPTEVPFTSIPLGKTTFQITTCTGRCLHTYDLRRGLHLVFITRPQTPADITASLAWKDCVLAAWGRGRSHGVWVFRRGKQVAELEPVPGRDEPIQQLLVFGRWIVGVCAHRIEVWTTETFEHYTTILATPSAGGVYTSSAFTGHVCHMPTFLNKILVGKEDGSVEIWNLSTSGPVTALEATPALFLVAIARADSTLTIHDVRADQELLVLNRKAATGNPITSMSFRSDDLGAGTDGRKAGVLATATLDSGDVTLWDLNQGGRVMGILYSAHDPPSSQGDIPGGITRVEFLPGQAVMVTTGRDNALKTWIFDEAPFSPIPRPLHNRSGHAGGINQLHFLAAESDDSVARGKWLLSAGRDHGLWGWSLRRDNQSTELSQGNIRRKHKKLGHVLKGLDNELKTGLDDLKAPEITCMAACMNRDGGMNTNTGGGAVWANVTAGKKKDSDRPDTGWESIVTGHRGDKFARTWFWGRKKAGRWAFATSDGTAVSAVGMSPCGTFALVGSEGGGIDMFNLQSGIHRQKFPAPLTPAQAKKQKQHDKAKQHDASPTSLSTHLHGDSPASTFAPGRGKHTLAVRGLVIDNVNRTVISCGLDGCLKFWSLARGVLEAELNWAPMAAMTGLRLHRSSDLLAVGCDDLSIRVVDIETRRVVRELWGCVGSMQDFTFSNDGRWIVAASADGVIRVWDLPTGHLIDAMRLESACTALAFSATGEFLATAHANSIGVHLWTNRTLFTHVPTRQIDEAAEVSRMALPSASGEGGEGLLSAAYEKEVVNSEEEGAHDIPPTSAAGADVDTLAADLTTLSLVPRSRWQTLLHLDTIRARNKPIEAPKQPEKAPFFLPSVEKIAQMKGSRGADEGAPNGNNTMPSGTTDDAAFALQVTTAERSRVAALQRLGKGSEANGAVSGGIGTGMGMGTFTQLLHASASVPAPRHRDSHGEVGSDSDSDHDSSMQSGSNSNTSSSSSSGSDDDADTMALDNAITSGITNGVTTTISSSHESPLAYLASLSPPAADLEIRSLRGNVSLSLSNGDVPAAHPRPASINERALFVTCLTARLRQRRDFELIQAWMAVFLKLHGSVIPGDGELRTALEQWRAVQKDEADRLGGLGGYVGGVLGFIRSGR